MRGANFARARLDCVNLHEADLTHVNLDEATLSMVIMPDGQLKEMVLNKFNSKTGFKWHKTFVPSALATPMAVV